MAARGDVQRRAARHIRRRRADLPLLGQGVMWRSDIDDAAATSNGADRGDGAAQGIV